MNKFTLSLFAVALATAAQAQTAVQQTGPVTNNRPVMWSTDHHIRQAAGASGDVAGKMIEGGFSAVGDICTYSATTNQPNSSLCIQAGSGGPGNICVDGTCYAIPASVALVGSDAIVSNNVALKGIVGATGKRVTRLGFLGIADGGLGLYNWSAANCAAADDGAQVQPSGTGCWIADFSATPSKANVRVWGAKGDSTVDDAPAFRAACAYALSDAGNGTSILVPAGRYELRTADPRGAGVLYLGTGTDNGRSCSLIGTESAMDYPSGASYGGPATLVLGPGVNRPLIYIPLLGSSPHIKNLTLHGSKNTQSGWAGGPLGKLYTVQVQDAVAPNTSPETGPIWDDAVIEAGYNGNLYVGSGRYNWSHRLWSLYAGQDATDCSVWEQGYDSVHMQPAFGSNTGCGMYVASGSQFQIFGGAMWSNTTAGLRLGGLQVNYMSIVGTNFQYNTYGIYNLNYAPFAGAAASSITCTNCAFDGNTQADVYISDGPQINRQMKLISPSFIGNVVVASPKPVYNIEIAGVTIGAGIVDVITPSLGSAGNPFTTAFTNAPHLVYCTGHECPSTAFLPTFGNGTPTYTLQQGYATRFGHLVHLSVTLSTSALGGPTGNMVVGGIPYSVVDQPNYASPCAIGGVGGWTAPVGATWLTAQMVGNSDFIQLFTNGSGVPYLASVPSQWAAASTITVSCTYVPAT